MNATDLDTVLAAATLIVVAVASVAAIVQLRHLRTSNQLNALLAILNQWNLPTVQAALSELRAIPTKVSDSRYVELLETPGALDRDAHSEFLALDLWEQIGTYAKRGLIDEAILLDITSSQVVNSWKCAESAIAILRKRSGPSAFENFEYLAVRATLWNRRYPNGTYPAGTRRMQNV